MQRILLFLTINTMQTTHFNIRWTFFICLFVQSYLTQAQSFCPSYFDMHSPVLVSGTDKQVGAIYKFANAAPDLDVYIKIENISNAYLAAMDRTDLGYGYAWQPHIPTLSDAGGYIDWIVSFKVAGTNTDAPACPSFTAIDIDGAGAGFGVREYIQANGYTNYNTLAGTALNISNPGGGFTLKALGVETVYDGISTTEQSVMIQVNYTNVTSLKYRTGVQGHAVESSGRYFSLHFNTYLNCDNADTAGQIGSNETLCGALDPQNITNTTSPSGGTGAYQYQWLKNTVSADPNDINWDIIPNTNSNSYDPPTISVTTHYMRQVRCANCAKWLSSNVVTKTVGSGPTVTISANVKSICPNGSVNFTSTVNPSGSHTYQWQSSTDNTTWADISGATAATRAQTGILGDTYFRLKVVSNVCTVYSASIKITTFDTTPPVFTSTPPNTTVLCSAVPTAPTLSATDNCTLQDIVYHESYSTCNNPVLNTNGGFENVTNEVMDATFYGFPARKLPNFSKTLGGWEMGFPSSAVDPGLLVHDNNNSINNPEGNHFLWVPGNGYCVLNDPITLQAGQCIEISLWAAALANANPQQGSRIQVEIIKMSDNSMIIPYTQMLPASSSINNMNWQNIVVRFPVPSTGSYRFVITQAIEPTWGPPVRGMAIDGYYLKECCTTAPSGCENYTITRTWTARDITGNATKHTQIIDVVDSQAPVLQNVPSNMTICGAIPALAPVTATDNCDATPSVTVVPEVSTKTNNGSCTDNFYTITRVWKAKDKCGNEVTATQVITVVASPTPTITATAFCSGGSTTLLANVGACISTATYQWQRLNGATWENVGNNSVSFTTPTLTSNQDYRVIVTIPNSTCSGTSTTYTAKPSSALAATISTTNATVCTNSTAFVIANVTGGAGNFTYKWEESPNGNSNWTTIANQNQASLPLNTSSPSNKHYRVIVTADGNGCGTVTSTAIPVKVDNSAGCDCVLQSCSAYTKLVYKDGTQITDVDGLVGDRWRFKDVATGYDAIIEITKAVNAISLKAVDNTAVNIDDWCPEINFNFLAGQDSYVDWKITIVAAGTETPTNLPTSSRVTSYDVDGNSNFREIHGHINSNGYILNSPTELSIVSEPPFALILGSTNEYNSISTDSKVKATFYYPGQNNIFSIRTGVRTTTAVGAAFRQFAVSFDPCISYTNPDVNPQKPEITGTAATCVGGGNQTYTTTQPFGSYNWTVMGGTIVSGQGTRTITVDWTSTGDKIVNVSTIDANGCIGTALLTVKVTEDPSVSINASTNSAAICQGQNTTLSAVVTGGTVAPTYQWFSSTDNSNWVKIDGANASTYQVTGSSVGTMYYQVEVSFENTGCNKATSAGSKVETVAPLSVVNPLMGFTECLGGTKQLEITTAGGKNATYQWQFSVDGATDWKNIQDSTGISFIPPSNAIGKRFYRVIISSASSGCASTESNPVEVSVVADPKIDVSVSATSVCSGATVILTATINDPSNSCSIEWFSKIGSAEWSKIPNASSPTYKAETLNNTTRYKVGLNCAASGCCN
jgi:large repetitive protein